MQCKCQMKMKFNEGIAKAQSDIGEEISDTFEFPDEHDEVNSINAYEKEIDKIVVQETAGARVDE